MLLVISCLCYFRFENGKLAPSTAGTRRPILRTGLQIHCSTKRDKRASADFDISSVDYIAVFKASFSGLLKQLLEM